MSKIKDELINKYSSVIDNYFEHSQHFKYDSKCSECYKEVMSEEESDSMFGIDLELAHNSYN